MKNRIGFCHPLPLILYISTNEWKDSKRIQKVCRFKISLYEKNCCRLYQLATVTTIWNHAFINTSVIKVSGKKCVLIKVFQLQQKLDRQTRAQSCATFTPHFSRYDMQSLEKLASTRNSLKKSISRQVCHSSDIKILTYTILITRSWKLIGKKSWVLVRVVITIWIQIQIALVHRMENFGAPYHDLN